MSRHPAPPPGPLTTWACDYPEGPPPDTATVSEVCGACRLALVAAAVNTPNRAVTDTFTGRQITAAQADQVIAADTTDRHVLAELQRLSDATSAPSCGDGAHRLDVGTPTSSPSGRPVPAPGRTRRAAA